MSQIGKPGVYDISADDYHADNFLPEPSLSSSIAKLLVTPGGTPLHARHESPRLNPEYEADDSQKFDLGKAAHSLILNDPQAFEIIDAADYKKDATRDRRDLARAAGKIPLLAHQYEAAMKMVAAARVQLDAHEEAHVAFADGRPEMTLAWREDCGIWCRARLDWLPNRGRLYFDYKSTAASADPDLWGRTALGMGADFQCAFYLRGIRKLGLCQDPRFLFCVQENFRPFALSVVGLMPGLLDLAGHQVERAIHQWSECLRTGEWPGYPRRTAFIDAPEWHEARLMAREERQHEASKTELRRAADMQAPL